MAGVQKSYDDDRFLDLVDRSTDRQLANVSAEDEARRDLILSRANSISDAMRQAEEGWDRGRQRKFQNNQEQRLASAEGRLAEEHPYRMQQYQTQDAMNQENLRQSRFAGDEMERAYNFKRRAPGTAPTTEEERVWQAGEENALLAPKATKAGISATNAGTAATVAGTAGTNLNNKIAMQNYANSQFAALYSNPLAPPPEGAAEVVAASLRKQGVPEDVIQSSHKQAQQYKLGDVVIAGQLKNMNTQGRIAQENYAAAKKKAVTFAQAMYGLKAAQKTIDNAPNSILSSDAENRAVERAAAIIEGLDLEGTVKKTLAGRILDSIKGGFGKPTRSAKLKDAINLAIEEMQGSLKAHMAGFSADNQNEIASIENDIANLQQLAAQDSSPYSQQPLNPGLGAPGGGAQQFRVNYQGGGGNQQGPRSYRFNQGGR